MADYISREALITASCERCNGEYVPCDKEHCLLMEVIHSIPAADVRPVVRASWKRIDFKPRGHDYECSSCRWKNDMATHFCPNCGAKMDKDGDGE